MSVIKLVRLWLPNTVKKLLYYISLHLDANVDFVRFYCTVHTVQYRYVFISDKLANGQRVVGSREINCTVLYVRLAL